MELKEVIEKRRSFRSYKKDDINKDIIEDILNCGRLAPSAKNRQPWNFLIVKRELKDKIADLMLEYTKNNNEKRKSNFPSSVKETAKIIKQAPVLILILRPKETNWLIEDSLSIGACVENMCLRATDLGLGSLWIRDIEHVSNQIEKIIGYSNLELSCALLIGLPREFPKQRPRKELKDIVRWY